VEDGSLGIDYFYCVTYGNGLFVAGGSDGKGAYSSDGITWTAIPDYPFEEDARILAYGNGRFIAYAANFQSYYPKTFISDNGMDWAVINGFPLNNNPYNIVYANGIFIAVSANAKMAYSFDGEIWYPEDRDGFTINAFTGRGDNLRGIAYGNGRFVIGSGGLNSSRLAWCDVPVFAGEKITAEIIVEKSPFQRVMFEGTYEENGNWNGGAIGQIDEAAYTQSPEQYMRYLLEENKGWSFGDSLELLSRIKIDTGTNNAETWFSSHRIYDNVPADYFWLHSYVVNADGFRAYRIPFNPIHDRLRENGENVYGEKIRSFSVLDNLPGNFNKTAWLFDVNGDGFDEIIGVLDDSSSTPYGLVLLIIGYDKDKDDFVNYLNITTVVLNTETGPEPVQYVQNQGVWGFRCLLDRSKYTPLYPSPSGRNEDLVWCFFTWNENEKRYTESEFIRD
jgi:hypothetical protein